MSCSFILSFQMSPFESILEIEREKLKVQKELLETKKNKNFLCSKVKANKDGNRQKEQINC